MAPQAVTLRSGDETLSADLYGQLPARRAAILVHGQAWNADGWRDVAPLFVDRGVPALALNLRGHGASTGETTEYAPPAEWSPVTDLRAAKALLRERGAREIALVGSSLGGHAVLASTFERDIECVVSISAPVTGTPDEVSRRISGRKMFACASDDSSGATPHVLRCFSVAALPKTLHLYGGTEHSSGMFKTAYGQEMLEAIAGFVARGL